jgi:hypothetical protein
MSVTGSDHKRPSPAIVAAVLIIVVALAGTAVAQVASTSQKSGKLTAKIKKIARKQANRQITRRAPRLSVASAESAGDSGSLGGAPASAYVQRAELAPVPVTNLALKPGWEPIVVGDVGPPRAYRDQLGVVHLAGLMRGTGNIALTLPPELRPAHSLELIAVCDEPGLQFDPRPGVVFIYSEGSVDPLNSPSASCDERLSLDGITFRAGG